MLLFCSYLVLGVEALDTCVESDLSLSQTDGVIRDLHKEKLLLINK